MRTSAQIHPPTAVLPDGLVSFTQLLLVNEKWAREYRTMKRFYSEKVQSEQKQTVLMGLLSK